MAKKQTPVEELHESIYQAVLIALYSYHKHMETHSTDIRTLYGEKRILTMEENLKHSQEAFDLYNNNNNFRVSVEVLYSMILNRMSFFDVKVGAGTKSATQKSH
jgi:hypothetical protein